jgi:DNA polymerase III delta prime subunit
MKGRLMGIAQKEGLKLDSQTLEQMIVSKHSDIRQVSQSKFALLVFFL